MKLIFSRKGFDAEYGGSPSPILPTGELVSLPIPAQETRRFSDLSLPNGEPLWNLIKELGIKGHRPSSTCHLDPDLFRATVPRKRGWKPNLGQNGAAASHLGNNNVDVGDVFMFFGYFRQVQQTENGLQFLKGKLKDRHVLYGWLQIGKILDVGPDTSIPRWLEDHPHATEKHRRSINNRIYIASNRLSFAPEYPGAGLLGFSQDTNLTVEGKTRSCWNLDHRIFGRHPITYHSESSWKEDHFRAASKGQEFVTILDRRVEAWIKQVLRTSFDLE